MYMAKRVEQFEHFLDFLEWVLPRVSHVSARETDSCIACVFRHQLPQLPRKERTAKPPFQQGAIFSEFWHGEASIACLPANTVRLSAWRAMGMIYAYIMTQFSFWARHQVRALDCGP